MNKAPAKKWMRRITRTLLAPFLLFNMSMAFNAWKFTHYYDDPELRKPQPRGFWPMAGMVLFGRKIAKRLNDSLPAVPFRKVLLNTLDGIQLEAWSIDPPGGFDSAGHDRSVINTIIMFHGHGSCKSSMLSEADVFLGLKYRVFMVDFRAHGGSQGSQTTIGMKEAEDVRCAYAYVASKTKQAPILYGISMGASTITRAIAEFDLHPEKTILEMPFGSLDDALKGFLRTHAKGMPLGFAPFLNFWGSVLNGGWGFSHRPTEFAKKISCPSLVEWGVQDQRVGRQEVQTIFTNIRSAKKALVVYETAGHESFCKKEHAKWVSSVSGFLSGK